MALRSLKEHFLIRAIGGVSAAAVLTLSVVALAREMEKPFPVEPEPVEQPVLPEKTAPKPAKASSPAAPWRDSLYIHVAPQVEVTTDYFGIYYDFCKEYPQECGGQGSYSAVMYDDGAKALLSSVNVGVNEAIHYRLERTKDYDDRKFIIPQSQDGNPPQGDCEDYALLKRKILREHGVPQETMMIGLVTNKKTGGAHAILIVRTTGGDYVLDNRHSEVKLARDTEYSFGFISLQSNDRLLARVVPTDDSGDLKWLNTYGVRPAAITGPVPSAEEVRVALSPPPVIVVSAGVPAAIASSSPSL